MPTIAYEDDDNEDHQYARLLFEGLTRQELINSHAVENETVIDNDPNLDFLRPEYSELTNSELMRRIGEDLKKLSEAFARSRERDQVMQRARDTNILNITQQDFNELLDGLFSGNITRERIVVLLFFCSDAIVNAYQNRSSILRNLFNWSLNYIINHVCDWVSKHGGWTKVIGNMFSGSLIYWLTSAALAWMAWRRLKN